MSRMIARLMKQTPARDNPNRPMVVTGLWIGTIRGGNRYNVIADEVVMEGTVRTLSPKIQDMMPERIRQVACGIAESFGARPARSRRIRSSDWAATKSSRPSMRMSAVR